MEAENQVPPDRRTSYEMEGVVEYPNGADPFLWERLTPEQQRNILLHLPEYHVQRNLYDDFLGDRLAPGPEMLEPDPFIGPFCHAEYERETERARNLSMKVIKNAPSWRKDLPWTDMRGITLEELIIYFPNHVARWPGFAAYLRSQTWDRLFYRTARLINLARGSHGADRREDQHVEVLPLMMKVERSIKEVAADYAIHENPAYTRNMKREWFYEHYQDKPAGFPPNPSVVTLAEAAGYITGTHELQGRQFSQRVRHLQPNASSGRLPARRPADFPIANVFFPDTAPPSPVGATSVFDPDVELPSPGVFPPGQQLSFGQGTSVGDVCPLGTDCSDLDCSYRHSREEDAWQQQQQQLSSSPPPLQSPHVRRISGRICRNGENCENQHCRFLHPGEDGYPEARNPETSNETPHRGRNQPHGS